MARSIAIVVALSNACTVATRTCPSGAKLITAQQPAGRAEWCETTGTTFGELPVSGRSFEGAMAIGRPAALPSGVDGPFTSWYPDGTLQSHGHYVANGARSLPEGLWAFWRPNGQRWVLGVYQHGEPIGCFAEWDQNGRLSTGTVQGDQLRVEACTPPPDTALAILESRARPPDESPPWADVSLQSFVGPNHLGAANPGQASPDPGMTLAFSATARKRFGRLRVGPALGWRVSGDSDSTALLAGASVGWELPSFHPRIESEVSVELAVERLDVTALRAMSTPTGIASLTFWSPVPAVQVGMAFALSPIVSAVADVRVDGLPARAVERDVVYCDFGCAPPVRETWQIGSVSFGANLGVRLLFR